MAVDSLLAQVYSPGGSLLPHTDADLSWGLGVSVGAEAVFECLPGGHGATPITIKLRSGDIIAGEFGAMRHAVRVPRNACTPIWWQSVMDDGDVAGAVRCNILFRQSLSEEEILSKGQHRAKALYGMNLHDLAKREGISIAHLCVRLRHEAIE